MSQFISTFGPTILVCLLFLGWVYFDRMMRVEPMVQAQDLVAESVRAYRSGRIARARSLLDHALTLQPDLKVAREMELLLRQPPAQQPLDSTLPDK